MLQNATNVENIISDRKYYISKLKQAILLLQEKGMSIIDICQSLDIEFKEFEYIVYDM